MTRIVTIIGSPIATMFPISLIDTTCPELSPEDSPSMSCPN